MRNAIAAVGFLLLAACTPSAPNADTAAELEAIHAVEASQMAAFDAKDVDAAVAPYAAEAVFALTGAPAATTPEAIHAMFQGMIDDPNSALIITPDRAEVSASGDMAYTTAAYTVTVTDPTTHQPVTTSGTNMTAWKKQADGSWRIVADYNIDLPAR
jgi:uncharacterized protein (TIGR02246 family)